LVIESYQLKMFFEEVHRSIHKIIALLHLAVDSEGPPKTIDQTTSDEMSVNFNDTLHAYGSIFQVLGDVISHREGDEGKLSVPAENQSVVKGEAGEGSDATKHQSKYTKQESAYASLPVCDYHSYFRERTRVRGEPKG
jgi:hypothetical protein